MFLAPGAIYAGLPSQFAYPAALGDLIAAMLALLSIPAVLIGHWSGRLLVWAFNVEGSLDLLTAITLATVYAASPLDAIAAPTLICSPVNRPAS